MEGKHFLAQTQPCLLPCSAALPYPSPRPGWAGGNVIPASAKAGKGGKGKWECYAQLVFPGRRADRAGRADHRADAGRRRRPWVKRPRLLWSIPNARKLEMRARRGAQGCPHRSAFSFPRRWGLGRAVSSGRLTGTGSQVHTPQACEAVRAAFHEGKRQSGSVVSLSRQDREGKRGGGRRR